MLKSLKRSLLFTGVLCALVAPAAADVENWNGMDIDIEYWVGTGSNEAICVIDFGSADPAGSSYAFGYRWNGSATSESLLLALDGDGVGATVDVTYHYETWGFALDSLSYQGYDIVSDPFWDPNFAGFWWDGFAEYTDLGGATVPAEAPNGTFSVAMLGAGDRALQDGFMDAWTQEAASNGYNPIHTPAIPTPEPASLSLLGLGGLAMLRRRRRK